MLDGLSPFRKTLDSGRGVLCLLGNLVSPVQVLWVAGQVLRQLGVLQISPCDLLRHYLSDLRWQKELAWPSAL